jgi:uncharacterized surface protein with fasciclin (FAS1) repeats
VSGCDPEDEGPTMNIKDLIASSAYAQATTGDPAKSLDTLVYYINLYPDLQALMTGTTAHTFFAPSNAAFQSLKATPGFPTNPNALKLINKSVVMNVLLYHFSEGQKTKAELTSGLVLDSKFTDPLAPAAAQKITVNADGTLKASPLAANVAIDLMVPDGAATNGMVHVIEAVMIPPSTGEVLIPILGQVAGSIILAESFSNLTKVIMFADAGFTENQATLTFKVTKWLAMPITSSTAQTANLKGITFFAPPNAAGTTSIFTEAAANAIIGQGAAAARAFLLNHLVVSTPGSTQTVGQYIVGTPPTNNPDGITKFAVGQTINPMTGAAKRVFVNIVTPSATVPTGVVISNDVSATPPPATSFKPILLGDQKALNGYFHVIGGVLN